MDPLRGLGSRSAYILRKTPHIQAVCRELGTQKVKCFNKSNLGPLLRYCLRRSRLKLNKGYEMHFHFYPNTGAGSKLHGKGLVFTSTYALRHLSD